jgi:hypothetical protein
MADRFRRCCEGEPFELVVDTSRPHFSDLESGAATEASPKPVPA